MSIMNVSPYMLLYILSSPPSLPSLSGFTRLDQAVTPLRDTPYETQLATKAAAMQQALREAAHLIQKEDSNPVSQCLLL